MFHWKYVIKLNMYWGTQFSKLPWLQTEQIIMIVVKKHSVLCDPTILGFQPGLYLGKNVRTPYSVWGINMHVIKKLRRAKGNLQKY